MAVYFSARYCTRCVAAHLSKNMTTAARSLLLPSCNAVYTPGNAWPVAQQQRYANTVFKKLKAEQSGVDNTHKIRLNKMLRLAIRDADGAADLEKDEGVAAAIKLCTGAYTKAEIKKILLNNSLNRMPETFLYLLDKIDGLIIVVDYRAKNQSIAKGVLNKAMTRANYKMDISIQRSTKFVQKGFVYVDLPIKDKNLDEEEAMTLAIEVGAEEVEDIGGCLKFTCGPTSVNGVVKHLGIRDIKPSSFSVDHLCLYPLQISEDQKKKLDLLIEKIQYTSKYGPEGFELIQITTNVAE